jgi:hypothetical protein
MLGALAGRKQFVAKENRVPARIGGHAKPRAA